MTTFSNLAIGDKFTHNNTHYQRISEREAWNLDRNTRVTFNSSDSVTSSCGECEHALRLDEYCQQCDKQNNPYDYEPEDEDEREEARIRFGKLIK